MKYPKKKSSCCQHFHLRPCLLIETQGKRTAGTGVDFVVSGNFAETLTIKENS